MSSAQIRVESWHAVFDRALQRLLEACQRHYDRRLVALAVYGSAGRYTMRTDSDLDFVVVAEPLPDGRLRRVADFEPVEEAMAPVLDACALDGVHTSLSPIFKTPDEIRRHSPLMLDMTQDARILFDRNGFLQRELRALGAQLDSLGARRVWQENAWWWDLKPDLQAGEVIAL